MSFLSPAYDDLVVPLKQSCPEAMTVPNSAGVTPEDLLAWRKQTEVMMMAPGCIYVTDITLMMGGGLQMT